jgi:hypothetical protein
MKTESALLDFAKRRFRQYADVRRNSVETRWHRNSEAYRADKQTAWATKWKDKEAQGWRSDTFVNVTHQKCLAAQSLLTDMIMENGKVPFQLESGDDAIETQFRPQLEAIHDDMERVIRDVNVDRELSRNVLSMCVFGETYAKFGVKTTTKMVMSESPDGGEPIIEAVEEPLPEWLFVPVWDLFFDVGFDTLDQSPSVIHRMYLGKAELKAKAQRPYFIADQIEGFLRDRSEDDYSRGRGDSDESPRFNEISKGGAFPVFEYWGTVPRSAAEAFELTIGYEVEARPDDGGDSDVPAVEDGEDDVEVMLWYADDRIVRYTRVEQGDRPFVRCNFEEVIDSNWGIGVADNISDVQKVLNGAVRTYEDNKRLSGNVIIATKDRYFESEDTSLSPGKVFHLTEDCQDARQAIQSIVIPDVGAGLMEVITLFNDRFADEFSQLPKVTQGIHTKRNITAFEISQQVESAGKYLAMVVRNIDEYLLEPMLEKFYAIISAGMDLGFPPELFRVKTLGYKTFQNKIVRIQKLQQMMAMVAEPQIGQFVKIRELVTEIAKAYDVDHDKFIKTDEELQAEAEQQAEAQQIELQGVQLGLEKLQAEIALLQARAADTGASAQSKSGKLDIDRAKLVNDIEKQKAEEVAASMGAMG